MRVFQIPALPFPTFPADVSIHFHFEPARAFGSEPHSNLISLLRPAQFVADPFTGRTMATPNEPWPTVSGPIVVAGHHVEIEGSAASIRCRYGSIDEVEGVIQQIVASLPPLLGIVFAIPVVVARVVGTIGNTPFKWAYRDATGVLLDIALDTWPGVVSSAWAQLAVVSAPEHRRITAALSYFHTASRLREVGQSPWEFMGEIILNFAKMLEALFKKSEKWHDEVRKGLAQLGFDSEQIERNFIPALKLRDGLDSAHISLSALSPEDLRAVHDYSDAAVKSFRELARRLFELGEKARDRVATHVERQSDHGLSGVFAHLREWYPATQKHTGRYLTERP